MKNIWIPKEGLISNHCDRIISAAYGDIHIKIARPDEDGKLLAVGGKFEGVTL